MSNYSKQTSQKQPIYFHTEGLTVGYDGVPLIKNIELQVRKGEILTLIGPNGAGKTTILKSIIKQLKPVAGIAYLSGKNMFETSDKDLAKQMSVLLTTRVSTEMMTCEDVVATGRYPYTGKFGILSEEDHRIVAESMELVHISELKDKDFAKTSDGQKQRVMLARAICQQPDLIVLDEPTSFLDIKYKLEFLAIIQKMARDKQLSVIMSLHELDLAGRISDKIACVKGDKVDRFGPPEEIFTDGYIQDLYNLHVGSYDERTGNLELEPVEDEVKTFVLSGNGTGTEVFRRLQREHTSFVCGILWENDLDYPSAKALASHVIACTAFEAMTDSQVEEAKKWMNQCEEVICTLDEELNGSMAGKLLELKAYAKSLGKLRIE